MKKNFKKISTIIIILIYMIPFFFIKTKVSANQNNVTDDHILGALINSSQNGRTRGGSALMGRAGGHMMGGQRDIGSRFATGQGIKRGGNKVAFNPSLIDIDILFNDYITFYQDYDTGNDDLIIPINKTFQAYKDELADAYTTWGFLLYRPSAGTLRNTSSKFDYIPYQGSYKYQHTIFEDINVSPYDKYNYDQLGFVEGTYSDSQFPRMASRIDPTDGLLSRNNISTYRPVHGIGLDKIYNSNIDDYKSFHVSYVVLSNSAYLSLGGNVFPHNSNNLPTKNEFINNYTAAFNVTYDHSTNQLIKNDNYITYNLNDFSDNSVNVDNHYITNNYITIIESENGDNLTEQLNYTSLLERIISAIKDLPQQIRDKFNDFTGGGGGSEPEPVEEGKGFWTSLFEAIVELARSFGAFITSIPDLLLNLLDGLLGLVEQIVALFIPTAEQMEELKLSFNGLTDDLSLKFSPVTDLVSSVSDVYSSPKSIYDLTINYKDQEMHIIPPAFRQPISNFKPVLNGVLILSTFISIYKRFVGREDIIK